MHRDGVSPVSLTELVYRRVCWRNVRIAGTDGGRNQSCNRAATECHCPRLLMFVARVQRWQLNKQTAAKPLHGLVGLRKDELFLFEEYIDWASWFNWLKRAKEFYKLLVRYALLTAKRRQSQVSVRTLRNLAVWAHRLHLSGHHLVHCPVELMDSPPASREPSPTRSRSPSREQSPSRPTTVTRGMSLDAAMNSSLDDVIARRGEVLPTPTSGQPVRATPASPTVRPPPAPTDSASRRPNGNKRPKFGSTEWVDERAWRIVNNACFSCGKLGHVSKDCIQAKIAARVRELQPRPAKRAPNPGS